MQGLWSRAVPTQSTCRCVSCLSTTANGVTSRSGAAASRRRLRIGNSVTALYTSIFAAATLADANSKIERRREWEDKIAAVKAEVDDLKTQDQKILESLQLESKVQKPNLLSPERSFRNTGTFPPATLFEHRPNQPTRSFHTDRRSYSKTSEQIAQYDTVQDEEGIEAELPEELFARDDEEYLDNIDEEDYLQHSDELGYENGHLPDWVLQDPRRIKAIQTLALRQFAIRLILRPQIAHRYAGVRVNYARNMQAAGAMLPDAKITKLLEDVDRLRRRIFELQTNRDSKYDDIIREWTISNPEQLYETRKCLDDELDQILQSLADKKVSFDEAALQIAINILRSVDPDRTKAFGKLLQTFTRMHMNDLNDLLLRTLLPHMFFLPPPLISNIISFFRKSRNLKHMDHFLRMLSGHGYSVNLGPEVNLFVSKNRKGVEVIRPPDDMKPVYLRIIYSELIATALCFDQPQRADAYFELAKQRCSIENFNTLSSYLRFYSINCHWTQGKKVLRRAVDWIASQPMLPEDRVERLIVLMVYLCDANEHTAAAKVIINAAIDSGFSPDIALKNTDVFRMKDTFCTRWYRTEERTRSVKATMDEVLNRPFEEKYSGFANIVGDYLTRLEKPLHGETLPRLPNKSGGAYSGAIPRGKTKVERDSEVFVLRKEVIRMRELLAAIRKDHVEKSFNPENIPGPLNLQHKDEDESILEEVPSVPVPTSSANGPDPKPASETLQTAETIQSALAMSDTRDPTQTTSEYTAPPVDLVVEETPSMVESSSPAPSLEHSLGYQSDHPHAKTHSVTYDRVRIGMVPSREPVHFNEKTSSSARRRARRVRTREQSTAFLTISPNHA